MTTFLQPGDKIVLCAPSSVGGIPTDQEITDILVKIYNEQGVIVTFVALGAPTIPLTVVSVMRTAEKLKLVDDPPLPWQEPETMEPLRAHWDELNRDHPDYADHPRVP